MTLSRKGTLIADENNCLTELAGVFAAGDATNRGASIAIDAVAEGDLAAKAIDAYLRGLPLEFAEPYYSKKEVTPEMFADREKIARAEMSVKAPEYRRGNFEAVINGFTEEQARNEAKRCLECGCHDYHDCRLICYANREPISPEKYAGPKHECFIERKLEVIERDQGKCMLCNLCVRVCREEVGKGLLGLVGRGFKTVIRPELASPDAAAGCIDCRRCVEVCPTGALKLLK